MESVREFLNGPKGKWVTIAATMAAAVLLIVVLRGAFGDTEAVSLSKGRPFICAKTMKPFTYTLKGGDILPVVSPHSGERTGFPAEACFWTRDGQAKADPTYVLLNESAGKPGPTFCPDCDRLVVGHNPPARAGSRPPPLRAEFKPRP